jgi:hypothetical protein
VPGAREINPVNVKENSMRNDDDIDYPEFKAHPADRLRATAGNSTDPAVQLQYRIAELHVGLMEIWGLMTAVVYGVDGFDEGIEETNKMMELHKQLHLKGVR